MIRRGGQVERGRRVEETGAHTKGHNKDSIGICLAGGLDGTPNYTEDQWRSLRVLCRGLCAEFGIEDVSGHNNYTDKKACPCFDVRQWWASL